MDKMTYIIDTKYFKILKCEGFGLGIMYCNYRVNSLNIRLFNIHISIGKNEFTD